MQHILNMHFNLYKMHIQKGDLYVWRLGFNFEYIPSTISVKSECTSYSFRTCLMKWNYNVQLSGIIFNLACIYKRINKEQWYRGTPRKVHTAWDLITTLRRLCRAKRVCKNLWIYEGFYDDVNRKVPAGPQKRS